jgi:hypothetical protein
MDVKIKYNNIDACWVIMLDYNEHLVDEIEINCKSYTSGDFLVCKAKNVSFKTKKNQKIAVIL